MSIIDQVRDTSGVHLHRLSFLFPLPDFVKSAERITEDDVKSIAPTTFADRAGRRYPCHTKAATYLSWLYFLDSEPDMTEKQARDVRENLERMSTVWGLNGPNGPVPLLKQAFEKRSAAAWSSLADEDYGLVVKRGDETIRRFPMPNAVSVKKAAETLFSNRDKYPLTWRKTAAQRILAKVASLTIELPEDSSEYLHKAAGYGFSTPDQLRTGLLKRASALWAMPRQRAAAEEMKKVAAEIASQPITPELLIKTAEMVDELDRRTGLYQQYVTRYPTQVDVPMPEEIAFATTEKQAAEKLTAVVILTNGSAYLKDDLEKVGTDAFCAALGDEIEDTLFDPVTKRLDMLKAADVLPTLPRDDADNLSTALAAAGVSPVEKIGRQMGKQAGLSYDAAMDLESWRNFSNSGNNRGVNPRVITRASELAEQGKPSGQPTYVL